MNFENNPHTKSLHKHPYQACTRCVMDTSDPEIQFDEQGVCNHCRHYEAYVASLGDAQARAAKLNQTVQTLKAAGQNREYDCIMGLSGGVDSSYLAHYAVRTLGLRPLVVHVDSGWNSELAVSNIETMCNRLGIDLHTLVLDWDEMRDLQRAYFRSGVPNLDVPQDHAFNAAMVGEAKKYGIRNVLNGGNMQTESILPTAWGYDASDPGSLMAIHKRFGTMPLKTYPLRSDFSRLLFDPCIFGMRVHRPLEYIDYNKFAAKKLLHEELGWRDYGGKHYESRFTKFFQAHYLPTKFGYDKRKAHLASLIVSGQLSRDAALQELAVPLYDAEELESDITYFCKKLSIPRKEYEEVMASPPKTHRDYPNREAAYARMRRATQFASRARHALFGRAPTALQHVVNTPR
ncbi:N-acetyl sugar amidotransferase [Ramlibacter sp. AW1]|uniref:N-acetyl sugar amidotransferase n=1 Tax=Ramlibacter aurantiacus TaxID=2801330 RepID=A0A937D562_9BURK|nr:N-acetyl sugar amidotransferase [Ramlibacter aurantiacus]MBL0419573.1 N-acetyl sugar amidotransferase [Ramlibacter aurantiacus]